MNMQSVLNIYNNLKDLKSKMVGIGAVGGNLLAGRRSMAESLIYVDGKSFVAFWDSLPPAGIVIRTMRKFQ